MDKELKRRLQENPTNDKVLLEMLNHKEEFLSYLSSISDGNTDDPAGQDGSEDLDEHEDAEQTDVAQESHGEEDEEEEDTSENSPDINAQVEAKVFEMLYGMKRGKKLPKPKTTGNTETKKQPVYKQFGAL